MSEDVENGWPMDQDGDRHEGALMEDEEEEQEQRQRRARYHDDEDEEDEDEEEEAEGPSKKRRKRSHKKQSRVNRFLDMEAQVDSEDEPESSGDEGEEGFLAEPGFDGEGEDEDLQRRSSIHQRLDRAERELNDKDMANIAEQIEHRYRRTGATRYTGDPANIPQRLLMPSVNDANLWQVRVKPGKERDICFSLMRKAIDLEFSTRPLKILSAFQRDNLSGIIYVESRSQAQVQQSLNGLVNVFPGRGIALVPIEEMASLLQYKKKINPITEGAWVRIKRGKYQGDLAQVVDMTENGEEVGLKFIPRIDLNPKDEVSSHAADGKKRRKMGSGLSTSTRPPQRFFNVEEVVKVYSRKAVTMRAKGRVYVFQNDTFKDGYIEKDIRLSGIQTEDVNPTLDEITKFVKQQDGEDGEGAVDLSVIADASKKAAIVVLQPGDHVEVFEGEQTGVHGAVQSITGDIVTLSAEGLDLDGQNVEVEVPARSVRKRFKPGDHVKVMAGHNVDETGLIVSVVDAVVTFLSDMSLQEVSVFSKDLREAAEVGASTNVVGSYELHDLVQLDLQTVGVIFKTERDSFRVLDQNGQVRIVQPHQITMGRDSRRAIATDADGHELRVDDNVKEIDGESRKGKVLHIHQSFFAFLYNREITENGGVFVTRARSLTSVAPKNMLKPGGTPDLSKMNPAVGGAVQGGFVGSGAMGRGPRDRLIGVRVVIIRGSYKSYHGIVKDTNGAQARVELDTGNKVVTIEKDKLKRPGNRPGDPLQDLETYYPRAMGPPSGFNRGRSSNPYQDGFGPKTPWIGAGRTPNTYGGTDGRTPAWNASARTPNPYEGSKTPAWNASSRTPNPFADGNKTPAWNASRTPNPYQNINVGGWGGTTPGAGGWGGATPGRASGGGGGGGGGGGAGAWDGATPARAGAWNDTTSGRNANNWNASADAAEDNWNQASDSQPPYSAPTPGANPYSVPTPGAMGAPTPGASGVTPGLYGAPTPGNYSAPTPSFARTPGVASTPFVSGGVPDVMPRADFRPDQATWLSDPNIRRPGLCVKFKSHGSVDWHNGDYDDAEGVVIGVLQLGTDYVNSAQVYVRKHLRPGLPQELSAVPTKFLVPVTPDSKGDVAVALDGELRGQKVLVIEIDGDQLVIRPEDEEAGAISSARSTQFCKWVRQW